MFCQRINSEKKTRIKLLSDSITHGEYGSGFAQDGENFNKLVDDEDDVNPCAIETNNRHQYFKEGPKHTIEKQSYMFYNNIIALYNLFKNENKQVVFVANIPAAQSNGADGNGCCVGELYI